MHRYKIHSVLVCDKDSRLIGIVDSYAVALEAASAAASPQFPPMGA